MIGIRVVAWERKMVHRLVDMARREEFQCIVAIILPEKAAMLALARRLHFTIRRDADPQSPTATLELRSSCLLSIDSLSTCA